MRHLLRLLPVAAALVVVALLPAAASAKGCGPRQYRRGFYAYADVTKVKGVSCRTAWSVVNAYGRCRAHHRRCASALKYRTRERIIAKSSVETDARVHATRGARVIDFWYQHNKT